jgi:hypothetical protein
MLLGVSVVLCIKVEYLKLVFVPGVFVYRIALVFANTADPGMQ